MTIRLKKINQQTMVITGATSGIGLTTARMAAKLGANLVLAARNGVALDQLASELGSQGTKVATVVADVGKEEDVARIARSAVERFGHFDTWVNNAGVSVYGRLDEVDTEDFRRLFDTNFWGVVYGSREAVKHFKKHGAGALINLGSEASEVPLPLQGIYAASKHAIKAFTSSLRIEVEHDDAPISVTLIKPAGIDTMFAVHAKNYMDKEPALPPPVYAPNVVADAIIHAAQHPQREVFIGSAAKLNAASAYHTPGMLEKIFSLAMFGVQKTDRPSPPNRRDALYAFDPNTELRERSGMLAKVHETSSYTKASLQAPSMKNALIGGGLLFAAWSLARRQNT
jgi:short-subunit dehydrogenase